MRFEIDSHSISIAEDSSLQACHAMLTGKEVMIFLRIVAPLSLWPRSSVRMLDPNVQKTKNFNYMYIVLY
jgi:hypothetical protein